MAFEVHEATIDDAGELARLYHECFVDDVDYHACFHAISPSELEAENIFTFARSLECRWTTIYKAVNTASQRIVGFAEWDFPHTAKDESSHQGLTTERLYECNLTPWWELKGINLGVMHKVNEEHYGKKEQYFKIETDCDLNTLGVHPDFRRLGLGSRLLRAGSDAADKLGSRVYVAASPTAASLYRRHGFEQVDDFVVDLEEFGEIGVVKQLSMIREPVKQHKR